MDEFIKLLNPAYKLIQYRIKENKVIFHIASTIKELECPFCGSEYYGAAEPPVRCGESHLSGLTEPPQFVY